MINSVLSFGVLGVSRLSPDELERELAWIDAHVDGRPYGIDILLPGGFEGKGEHLTEGAILDRIPDAHTEFADSILAEHDLPVRGLRRGARHPGGGDTIADQLLDVCFEYPIKLIASALGVAPPSMIERAHQHSVPVAALVGSTRHAVKQVQAGVDILRCAGDRGRRALW